MSDFKIDQGLYEDVAKYDATRTGFGRGLKIAGDNDDKVIGLCADLRDSVQMTAFAEAHPARYIEVGVAEQNLATVGAGLARAGKVPFVSSYAAFSPGRNWEQIKTTAGINFLPVKVVGAHAGATTGPDGATHQMFEDIALMRVIPSMVVVCPGDAVEAEKATIAIAKHPSPCYLRLAREKTPTFSTADSPFEIGKAYLLREGKDVSILATGIETPFALLAAERLSKDGIDAEVVHVPTVKPLDEATILKSVKKTGRVVTCEDGQIAGGFGGAIAELLGDKLPAPILRIGIDDRYGESGAPLEVHKKLGLADDSIHRRTKSFVETRPQYRPGF